jgi:DNA-binding NtrC family response regulator
VRIVAATNRDLEEMVRKGHFRADLLHRLSGIGITLPPLRERAEDIPLLVEHFSCQARNDHEGHVLPRWTTEAMQLLQMYSWPGNVRQLRAFVLGILGVYGSEVIHPGLIETYLEHLPVWPRDEERAEVFGLSVRINLSRPLSQAVQYYKLAHVQAALLASGGDRTSAARMLGVTKSNFNRLVRSLGLDASKLSLGPGERSA